jgi:hypothetical protein
VKSPTQCRFGPVALEVAPDEIRAPLRERIRRDGPPRLAAALGALDAVGAHQPLHATTPHPFAGAP